MKKWFFLERWLELHSQWVAEVKYVTDEEALAIISDPNYKGDCGEGHILIFELSNTGEKIKRDDLIKKALES